MRGIWVGAGLDTSVARVGRAGAVADMPPPWELRDWGDGRRHRLRRSRTLRESMVFAGVGKGVWGGERGLLVPTVGQRVDSPVSGAKIGSDKL